MVLVLTQSSCLTNKVDALVTGPALPLPAAAAGKLETGITSRLQHL